MTIAAAKRADDQRHLYERSPIKAKLPDRRPHEAADKDHLAATFPTGEPTNPSELAEPNPMMRIGLDGGGIGPSAERKQHHRAASSHHRIGDHERYRPGAANDSERRVGRRIPLPALRRARGRVGRELISQGFRRGVARYECHRIWRSHASCSAPVLVRRIAFASGLVPLRIKARTPPTNRSSAHFPSTRANRSRNMPPPRNKSR